MAVKPFILSLPQKVILRSIKKYIDTDGTVSEFKALDPYVTYSVGRNPIDGYFYFVALSTGGPPLNRSTYVYKIDPVSLGIVDLYLIPSENSNTYDSHPRATIAFDNDGHLYVARERGTDTGTTNSNGHNTAVRIYKTSVLGDIKTLYLFKTISGKFSYAHITYAGGNNFFIDVRGKSSGVDLGALTILKTTDKWSTSSEHLILNTGAGAEARAYSASVYSYDDNVLYKVLNIRKDSLAAFESVLFLKSSDGVVWKNGDESYSKDIDSNGYLNLSELRTNFMVWDKPDDDHAINFEGGTVKDGVIRLLVAKSLVDHGNIVDNNAFTTYQELRMYTNNGSGWTYEDISDILPASFYVNRSLTRVIQMAWDRNNDYIHIVDTTNSDNSLYEYKSTDMFQSFTSKKLYDLGGSSSYGSACYNPSNPDKRLIVTLDVQGEVTDLNDYANLNLIRP